MTVRAAIQQPAPALKRVTPPTAASLATASHASARSLQGAIGNAATMRVLRSNHIQPKLNVSHPEDESEREADRVADQVMRMPDSPPPAINRTCHECEDELQLKPDLLAAPVSSFSPPVRKQAQSLDSAAPLVHEALNSAGQPLDPTTRSFFEQRFERDLSQVRVHSGPLQAKAAASVNALAYTVGSDIVFGRNSYLPHQPEGRRLLAHELVHVVQQSEGVAPQLQRFEAKVHQSVEQYGLTTDATGKAQGLSEQEATAVYFGNWMRDMNQVFVPMVIKLVEPENIDVVYAVINYLAFKKFGKTISAEQFGYYIPAEHIDNPAGLVGEYDLLPGQPTPKMPASGPQPPKLPTKFVTPQESTDPSIKNASGGNIFSVDKSGVMAFIRRSNLHVEKRLELAVERGRNPEGFVHFGAALHTVEDLFAHSNWIEIAVSKVLKDQPDLLPGLKGADRQVFSFSNEVQTKNGKRPVLTTGSFTGKDTKVSIGSEVVAVLADGLPEPASEAEQAAQAALTLQMLHATSGRARTDEAFRAAVRKVIVGNLPEFPGRDEVVDGFLRLPLEKIYKLTLLIPQLPKWVKEMLGITEIQKGIRYVISNYVMKPMSRQLQTLAIETQVSDTSLLKDLEENRAAAGKTRAAVSTKSSQSVDKKTEPEKRLEALEATPEKVLAGPSHSQIAKDHPNSPFFGLAVLLATIAVRSLREKMVAAWDERASKATAKHQFEGAPTDPKEKALYDERETNAEKSFERGKGIVNEGRDVSEEGGDMTEESFDLAARRKESANEIRVVATALRSLASAPAKLADAIKLLERLLQGLNFERLASGIKELQSKSTQPTVIKAAEALAAHATALEAIATDVQGPAGRPPTHDEREAANLKLQNERSALQGRMIQDHSIDATFGAAVLLILQRQVQSTAVSWTRSQRDVLEGRTHVLTASELQTLKVDESLVLPSVARQTTAVKALLNESRKFIGHPYDDESWWTPIIIQFIKKNESQVRSEIEARNAGYLVFRTPGAKESKH